jgi:hypothetical protein
MKMSQAQLNLMPCFRLGAQAAESTSLAVNFFLKIA